MGRESHSVSSRERKEEIVGSLEGGIRYSVADCLRLADQRYHVAREGNEVPAKLLFPHNVHGRDLPQSKRELPRHVTSALPAPLTQKAHSVLLAYIPLMILAITLRS